MGTRAIRDEYMACPLPFARFLRWPPDAPRGNGAIAHLDERRYNHQPSHAKKNNVSEMERRMGHKKGSADPMPAHPPSGHLPVPPLLRVVDGGHWLRAWSMLWNSGRSTCCSSWVPPTLHSSVYESWVVSLPYFRTRSLGWRARLCFPCIARNHHVASLLFEIPRTRI